MAIDKKFHSNFFKTTLNSAILTLFKMASVFLLFKYLAIVYGAEGVALLGQVLNLNNVIYLIGSLGISNGLTILLSKNSNKIFRVKILISVTQVSFICCFIILILFAFNSSSIAYFLFKNDDFYFFIIVAAIASFAGSFYNILIAFYNGVEKYSLFFKLSYFQIILFVATIFLSILLFGFNGIFLGIPGSYLLLILFILFNDASARRIFKIARKTLLLKYISIYYKSALMGVVALILVNLSSLAVRTFLLVKLNPISAGYWEAINRISGSYLSVVTLSVSTYYLPLLGKQKNNKDLLNIIRSTSKVYIPLSIIGALCIFISKDFIIRFLFSNQFLEVNKFIHLQLIGDLLKITSFLYAYIFWTKQLIREYLITEIYFSLQYLVLSYLFYEYYGSLSAIFYSYIINYASYFIFVYFFINQKLKN